MVTIEVYIVQYKYTLLKNNLWVIFILYYKLKIFKLYESEGIIEGIPVHSL